MHLTFRNCNVRLFVVAEEVIRKNEVLRRFIDLERNLSLPPWKYKNVQPEDGHIWAQLGKFLPGLKASLLRRPNFSLVHWAYTWLVSSPQSVTKSLFKRQRGDWKVFRDFRYFWTTLTDRNCARIQVYTATKISPVVIRITKTCREVSGYKYVWPTCCLRILHWIFASNYEITRIQSVKIHSTKIYNRISFTIKPVNACYW